MRYARLPAFLGPAGSLQSHTIFLSATNSTWAWANGTNDASLPDTTASRATWGRPAYHLHYMRW
jgi:hypothetical protein